MNTYERPVINFVNFGVFLQEAWDYIGSSRMVYDMLKGDFPAKVRFHFTNIN